MCTPESVWDMALAKGYVAVYTTAIAAFQCGDDQPPCLGWRDTREAGDRLRQLAHHIADRARAISEHNARQVMLGQHGGGDGVGGIEPRKGTFAKRRACCPHVCLLGTYWPLARAMHLQFLMAWAGKSGEMELGGVSNACASFSGLEKLALAEPASRTRGMRALLQQVDESELVGYSLDCARKLLVGEETHRGRWARIAMASFELPGMSVLDLSNEMSLSKKEKRDLCAVDRGRLAHDDWRAASTDLTRTMMRGCRGCNWVGAAFRSRSCPVGEVRTPAINLPPPHERARRPRRIKHKSYSQSDLAPQIHTVKPTQCHLDLSLPQCCSYRKSQSYLRRFQAHPRLSRPYLLPNVLGYMIDARYPAICHEVGWHACIGVGGLNLGSLHPSHVGSAYSVRAPAFITRSLG
ncbi:hypothetical protein KC325_g145 [Hortaea werneckii]|nr:hypothetical protein KC325_g145 [Hortaea werneckii]